MEATTLATFLTDVGSVLTAGAGWVGTVVGVITSNPPLLVVFALGVGGTAIGWFHSLR